MCVYFSLFVIILNFLLTNVECSLKSDVVKKKTNQIRKIRQFSETGEDWMKEILKVNEELRNVQAIIAKDEEALNACMTGSKKTNKRHLMCVGSILNDRHVLTSATCIHEATHIRHNLKAPLVVVVGSVKSNPQVIRVLNYKIHPDHIEFPYHEQHVKHNIAIIKLSCRIEAEHLTPIELPKAPYTEVCSDDKCLVAVVRRVGKTSLVMYDTRAKHISTSARKRRSLEINTELQSSNTGEFSPTNIQEKLKTTVEASNSQILKIENENNSDDLPFENLGMFISGKKNSKGVPIKKFSSEDQNKSIFSLSEVNNTRSSKANTPTTKLIADQYVFQRDFDRNDKVRLFSVRASDGFQGCPQSGSPVMFGLIQAALVSISCDDRQPGTPWKYTDIFLNANWIKEVLEILPNKTNNHDNVTGKSSGCSTCIYNFFIDLTRPNDKNNCNDLDVNEENSPKYKLCASHVKQKSNNNQSSTLLGDNPKFRNSFQTDLPNDLKRARKVDLRKKIWGKVTHSKNNKIPNFRKHTFKISELNSPKDLGEKDLPKYRNKDSKEIGKVNGRDLGRVLRMDFDQDFDKDIGKKFQTEFQRDSNKNFYKDVKQTILNDYYIKNMKKQSKDRLKKEVEIEVLKRNKDTNLNSSKVKTINSQQNIEYNPLAKKFQNLRIILARIQKSIPEKDDEKLVIGTPMKIIPNKEFPNSKYGIKHAKKEKINRQFAVLFPDTEMYSSK